MKSVMFLILIFLISCSSSDEITFWQNQDVSGLYHSDDGYQLLHLYNDSIFYYQYALSSFPMLSSYGSYRKLPDSKIELFSKINRLPMNISEKRIDTLDNIEFRILTYHWYENETKSFNIILDNRSYMNNSFPIAKLPLTENDFDSLTVVIEYKRYNLPVIDSIVQEVKTVTLLRKHSDSNIFEIEIPFDIMDSFGEKIKKDTLVFEGEEIFWKRKGKRPFVKWRDL